MGPRRDEAPPTPTPAVFVKGEPVHRSVCLVTMSVFMGYAILVSFQHKLKVRLGIDDEDHSRSELFTSAVSFLYIGNLIFRLAHNLVFACLRPRHRVYLSLLAMAASMLLIAVGVFLGGIRSMWVVFVAYALGGIAIGSFEGNLLSSITPLGHDTKVWAIVGMPTGFALILVGGFCLSAAGVPTVAIYFVVAAMLALGAVVFATQVPAYEIENNAATLTLFKEQMFQIDTWLPKIWVNCLALMIDMFCVSLFSGIMLYILNGHKVGLLSPSSDNWAVPHDWFFCVYNMFTLAGDSLSRKFAYRTRARHPMVYLVFSVCGAILCFTKIGLLAPFGIFFVFFANGAIYATSTRHIDMHVDSKYNLVALSVWLFVGDVGSVTGSNMLNVIRNWACRHQDKYACVPDASHNTTAVAAAAVVDLAASMILRG